MPSISPLRPLALSALFCAASLLGHAPPAEEPPFTIIPGAGLPSLASLNLTMKDLLDPHFDAGLWAHRPSPGDRPLVLDASIPPRRPDDVPTAAELANMMRPTRTRADAAMCQGDWGDVSAAQACVNYLGALGTQAACAATPAATFCMATDDVATQVLGLAMSGNATGGSATAACADVACAAVNVIDSCSQINPDGCQPVAGWSPSCGSASGSLVVWVAGRRGSPDAC